MNLSSELEKRNKYTYILFFLDLLNFSEIMNHKGYKGKYSLLYDTTNKPNYLTNTNTLIFSNEIKVLTTPLAGY